LLHLERLCLARLIHLHIDGILQKLKNPASYDHITKSVDLPDFSCHLCGLFPITNPDSPGWDEQL
jgi:hypothetical protein